MQTYYDIAVLEIEEVTFSPLVRPICLPEQDFLPGVNFINVLRTRFWYKSLCKRFNPQAFCSVNIFEYSMIVIGKTFFFNLVRADFRPKQNFV